MLLTGRTIAPAVRGAVTISRVEQGVYLERGGGKYGGGQTLPLMGQWAVGSDRHCAGQKCGSSGMRCRAGSAWTRAACR